MVKRVGAIKWLRSWQHRSKFNNGDVDACYVSAPAYQPFELWKGLGSNGGIVRLRWHKQRSSFGQHRTVSCGLWCQVETVLFSRFDDSSHHKNLRRTLSRAIGSTFPSATLPGFDELFQQTQISLGTITQPITLKSLGDEEASMQGEHR